MKQTWKRPGCRTLLCCRVAKRPCFSTGSRSIWAMANHLGMQTPWSPRLAEVDPGGKFCVNDFVRESDGLTARGRWVPNIFCAKCGGACTGRTGGLMKSCCYERGRCCPGQAQATWSVQAPVQGVQIFNLCFRPSRGVGSKMKGFFRPVRWSGSWL